MKDKTEAPETTPTSPERMRTMLSETSPVTVPPRPDWIDDPRFLSISELAANLRDLPICYREEAMLELFDSMILNKGGQELRDLLTVLGPYWRFITDERKDQLMNGLVRDGLIPLLILMESSGFVISDPKKHELNLFLTSSKLNDPAIEAITPTSKEAPKPLSEVHLSLYGDKKTQETYVKYYETAVRFAQYHIENTIRTTGDVRSLMDALAKQRRFRALDTATTPNPANKYFGMFRPGQASTSFGDTYTQFRSRLGDESERIVYISVPGGEEPIPVTRMTTDGWEHLYEGDRDALQEVYENAFLEACRPQETEEAALRKIAKFHWIAVNVMLWMRGSAAINEQLVDALFRLHFNKGVEKKAGVALDCEALSQPDSEKYIAFYLDHTMKKDARVTASPGSDRAPAPGAETPATTVALTGDSAASPEADPSPESPRPPSSSM